MAFEHKENAGSLFKNRDEEKQEHHADYKGDCKIDGVVYWMNAWINETKSGDKYMAVRFKRKDKQPQAKSEPQQQRLKVVGGADQSKPDPNDEIPF